MYSESGENQNLTQVRFWFSCLSFLHVAETLLALSLWFDRLTTPSETEGSKGGLQSFCQEYIDHVEGFQRIRDSDTRPSVHLGLQATPEGLAESGSLAEGPKIQIPFD